MDDVRKVRLRDEHVRGIRRYLEAYQDNQGNLHIDGQDLGPGAGLGDDDEYEWFKTVRAEDVTTLLVLLGGGPEDDDVLDLLAARYTGAGSYELEKALRDSDIRVQIHVR